MLKRLFLGLALIGVGLFSSASAAQAQDRRVLLINDSSQTIEKFHASNVNRRGWEEDILGNRILRPGQRIRINLDDRSGQCMFDFLTVMANGSKIEKRGVNVCRVETYRITN